MKFLKNQSYVLFLIFISIFLTIKIKAHDVAIVLMDMQIHFTAQENPETIQQLVDKQMDLLRWGKKHNIPVLIFELAGYGKTIDPLNLFIRTHMRFTLIEKLYSDGFENRNHGFIDPAKILDYWGAKNLIFCGINAPGCVTVTAEAALKEQFRVFSSSDIVADFTGKTGPQYPYLRPLPGKKYQNLRDCQDRMEIFLN